MRSGNYVVGEFTINLYKTQSNKTVKVFDNSCATVYNKSNGYVWTIEGASTLSSAYNIAIDHINKIRK